MQKKTYRLLTQIVLLHSCINMMDTFLSTKTNTAVFTVLSVKWISHLCPNYIPSIVMYLFQRTKSPCINKKSAVQVSGRIKDKLRLPSGANNTNEWAYLAIGAKGLWITCSLFVRWLALEHCGTGLVEKSICIAGQLFLWDRNIKQNLTENDEEISESRNTAVV